MSRAAAHTNDQILRLAKAWNDGVSFDDLTLRFRCSPTSIKNHLAKLKAEGHHIINSKTINSKTINSKTSAGKTSVGVEKDAQA